MIPVSDATHRRRFPFVNLAIILANFAVFFYELTLPEPRLVELFRDYGVVPNELTAWLDDPDGLGEPLTVITSAFLHGGWLHIFGNMLYLWVFGDNVEDALGHLLYPVFYVVSAVGAVAAQVAVDTNETIPMVGASGAIGGVLGGYLVLYPSAPIGVLVGWFFYIPVPAFLLIGFWFVLQFLTGIATLGGETLAEQGGVAVWAHVGGFLTGLALVLLARPLLPRRPLRRRPRYTDFDW